jgi:hypothetical protein
MKSSYVIQTDEKTKCPKCGNSVRLLAPYWLKRRPVMFYICFLCYLVVEVGKGEVPKE